MRMIRYCLAAVLLCVSALGADNSLKATPQELFKAFQAAVTGLVVGDSDSVLKYTSARYLQAIVDQNRKDLVKYREDATVRKAFEDLTGQPFDALLALSDRELAIIVIDKFIPSIRTPEMKKQIVSSLEKAVLEAHTFEGPNLVLQVKYADGTKEQAVFVQERNAWRLDECK